MELLHEDVTERIIGCLIAVHEELGLCLPEHSYQVAAALEMNAQGLKFLREPELVVKYRDVVVGLHKPDFIVEDKSCPGAQVRAAIRGGFQNAGLDVPAHNQTSRGIAGQRQRART